MNVLATLALKKKKIVKKYCLWKQILYTKILFSVHMHRYNKHSMSVGKKKV